MNEIDKIIQHVAGELGLPAASLGKKSGHREFVRARQLASLIAHRAGIGPKIIGRHLQRRHNTVSYYIREALIITRNGRHPWHERFKDIISKYEAEA